MLQFSVRQAVHHPRWGTICCTSPALPWCEGSANWPSMLLTPPLYHTVTRDCRQVMVLCRTSLRYTHERTQAYTQMHKHTRTHIHVHLHSSLHASTHQVVVRGESIHFRDLKNRSNCYALLWFLFLYSFSFMVSPQFVILQLYLFFLFPFWGEFISFLDHVSFSCYRSVNHTSPHHFLVNRAMHLDINFQSFPLTSRGGGTGRAEPFMPLHVLYRVLAAR